MCETAAVISRSEIYEERTGEFSVTMRIKKKKEGKKGKEGRTRTSDEEEGGTNNE